MELLILVSLSNQLIIALSSSSRLRLPMLKLVIWIRSAVLCLFARNVKRLILAIDWI